MTLQLPDGFLFGADACGIKPSGKPDISLIVGEQPLVAAGVYTQNQMVAAPVLLCQERTPSATIRAVVVNSGNANACTGTQGESDAVAMVTQVAQRVGCDPTQVLVMSTGIIGVPLPMDQVRTGIERASDRLQASEEAFLGAAHGILTTDQGIKVASGTDPSVSFRVVGMAKGAGMIAPNMATMLAAVLTDYPLDPHVAQEWLRKVADETFNCVSVDGHTSTNDTLLLLSSQRRDASVEPNTEQDRQFLDVLREVCQKLATELVLDGEGAQRVMELHVVGAETDQAARRIAEVIGNSNLVKTAVTGCDPNWGRIMSAAGYSGEKVDLSTSSLRICGFPVFQNGQPLPFDAAAVSQAMGQERLVPFQVGVGTGSGQCRYWASDLTSDYVSFNSEYTT